MEDSNLPITAIRDELLEALGTQHTVVSAPTGSGKSTQIPLWLAERGKVLVIEPRRVACRSLAARVAELSGQTLGDAVGYVVRDERNANSGTRVLFVTPGVALRMYRADQLAHYDTIIVDEFHERSLDIDLLLALALRRGAPRLVVMSATVDAARIAQHIGGRHVCCTVREHPVDVSYIDAGCREPTLDGLAERIDTAMSAAETHDGDVLVFLPGKREIESVSERLTRRSIFDVVVLHGELSLTQQAKAFQSGSKRRAILATNVAETSLTIPGIRVVVDSGLVRRTHYRDGRGFLRLTSIAQDSAAQRAGRAGRLGPGKCYRLWPAALRLAPSTPPEIQRESLTSLVLNAAACGARGLELPFLDPPADYAVEAATGILVGLGALDAGGAISRRGLALFGLPVDAHLGRLAVEARGHPTEPWVLALCATLGMSRRPTLVVGRDAVPSAPQCDAQLLINALDPKHELSKYVDPGLRSEAVRSLRRLQSLHASEGMEPSAPYRPSDARALAATIIRAWPRCVHVRRERGRKIAYANGGTEMTLGRESLVDPGRTRALIVLDSRAFTVGRNKNELVITAAMPVSLAWLVELGLGEERLLRARRRDGRVVVRTERVYAGMVIATREFEPDGSLAREAIRDLILDGRLFSNVLEVARERHAVLMWHDMLEGRETTDFSQWLLRRLEQLGVDSVDDIELLEDEDLYPEALPREVRERLERAYPRQLSTGDASYQLEYELEKRILTLRQTGGVRKTPPGMDFLPRLPGWRIDWSYKNRVRTLRD
ncbi:MAG: DEAD/DEAH box helicase [Gammaproteobacteria bacterium]|nr:DEAD/DEAH box helicase [Gammaproteobacteria bacterium]